MQNGIEKGEICNRNGCAGIIDEHERDGSCSCHLNPPCSYCTDQPEYCPECGWDAEEEAMNNERKPTEEEINRWRVEQESWEKSRKDFYDFYNSNEIATEFKCRIESHTHFSQIVVGWFNPQEGLSTHMKRINGTFGGRFEWIDKEVGRFKYIAYTD